MSRFRGKFDSAFKSVRNPVPENIKCKKLETVFTCKDYQMRFSSICISLIIHSLTPFAFCIFYLCANF